jgi:hypothetical protein
VTVSSSCVLQLEKGEWCGIRPSFTTSRTAYWPRSCRVARRRPPGGRAAFCHPGDVLPSRVTRPASGRRSPPDAQQRGFAAAVRAQQSYRFAARNPQRDIIDDDFLPTFQVYFQRRILITYSLSGR